MRPVLVLLAVATSALAPGCAGYRLGPTNQQIAGARTVFVEYFHNTTIEPRLVEAVNHSLRRHLQQDGTFRLVSTRNADVVVRGTIEKYDRLPRAFLRSDIASVQEYEILLVARVTAIDRLNGRALVDRSLGGRTTLLVGTDLVSAERQALPWLADDFARNVTTALAEGSW
jgi:hypothetical protein